MIKFQKLLPLVLLVLLAGSCKKLEDSTETIKIQENDTKIQEYIKSKNLTASSIGDGVYMSKTVSNATGRAALTGELLSLHFVISKLDGTKVDSSSILNNKPARLPKDLTETNILQVAASQLKLGETAIFLVPFYYGYGETENGSVPAYSPLRIDITLANIQNEAEQISAYMTENKYTPIVTDTGLNYQILTAVPNGDALKNGQNITVKYTGKLLYYSTIADANNKLTYTFDSGSFSFILGSTGVIPGFNEGIAKLKVGEKAILCFPSPLGYGDAGSKNNQGQYTILPKAPLAFEVEIVAAAN